MTTLLGGGKIEGAVLRHWNYYETIWEMGRRIRDTRQYMEVKPDIEFEMELKKCGM